MSTEFISYEDFVRANEALKKADVPTKNINWYYTGNNFEFEEFIRSFQTQQEEETMNDNLNDVGNTDGKGYTEFKPVPAKLTDAELAKLLEAKPESITVFVTDADETPDEPTPTIH